MLSRLWVVLAALVLIPSFLFCRTQETAAEDSGGSAGYTVVRGGHTFVMGTKTHNIPASYQPAKGQRTRDPVFFTTIVRITDKKKDRYEDDGVINEYARADPENSDGSLLILRGTAGDWHLYRTRDYKRLKLIRNPGSQQMEPRWDRKDPKLFYFVKDMRLCSYNVDSDKETTVRDFKKDFPGGMVVTSRTEGDSSTDRRYFCWQVQDKDWKTTDVFVYDRVANKITGRKAMRRDIDWISMSMSGKHCLVGLDADPIRSYTRDFKREVTLPTGSTHQDLALTTAGRDVTVYQNNKTDWIAMADLETAKETNLVFIPFTVNPAIGLHVSGNSTVRYPGWALVSTYGPKNPPAGKRRSWMDLQLFMVELKARPRVWRIASTHSIDQVVFDQGERQYFAEAFAAINTAGNRIYWGSNWENKNINRLDTYVALLPENWPALLPVAPK